MPISKHIADLTHLALRDRVLTFKERQVIVEAALKEGTNIQEINAFLDDAYRERLKTYSKEQLKRCPHCGAQIPLVSDVCLFCCEQLDSSEPQPRQTTTPPPYVTGDAAQQINAENARTAVEQHLHRICGAAYQLHSIQDFGIRPQQPTGLAIQNRKNKHPII
ncbi:MAG: hypothetical protein II480_04505 [Bacteroidales bacterium]|nr:hypothetical protein [Bacteroidales bacterium]